MAAPISPQPLVVGEVNQTAHETTTNPKQSYADQFRPKQSNTVLSKADLFPVTVVHGEPTVEFSIDDVNQFTKEEGLHQAVIMKFSYGKPDLQEFRKVFSSQFNIQGRCNIGLLEFRHVLVRFDLHNDFVQCISKTTGYVKAKGEEFFFRTFPWTMGFNPKEETSLAVVWISFPSLSPNLFAKRSLMSIASAVGKPISVDKATQDRTRPSAARVKVILDLLDKHPKKIKIVIFDRVSGKSIDLYQEVVYDNLPKYCTYCKHQGHYDEACRLWKEKGPEEMATTSAPVVDVSMTNKLQGDARNVLKEVGVRQAAIVQLGTEVEKEKLLEQQQITQTGEGNQFGNQQNAKAKGVAEVPKGFTEVQKGFTEVQGVTEVQGITEVIDPLVELTTAGEEKGIKAACLLARQTRRDSINGDNVSVQQLNNKVVEQIAFLGIKNAEKGEQNLTEKVDNHVMENENIAPFDDGTKLAKKATVFVDNQGGQLNKIEDTNAAFDEGQLSKAKAAAFGQLRNNTDKDNCLLQSEIQRATQVDQLGRFSLQKAARDDFLIQNSTGSVQRQRAIDSVHTCTADCKTCNGHVKYVQRAEGPQIAKGTEIKEQNVEKLAGHVKSGNAQIDAGHVKSDRVEHTVDGHLLALTDENVQQHIPDVVLQLNAADRDENDRATDADRDKAFPIANRPTDHVQIERPSSDAPMQAGQAILGTGDKEVAMTNKEGDWNLVTGKKSPTRKQVPLKLQNSSVRRIDDNVDSSPNSFEALAIDGDPEIETTGLQDSGMSKQLVLRSKQIVPCSSSGKEDQSNENFALDDDVRQHASKKNGRAELMGSHSSNAQTLHFSSPHVEQIIKESQIAMMMRTNMVKQPMVTLNKSVFDVPSQSVDSFGEPGQSTGNNDAFIKGNIRELVINSKLWDQQREEDEEEYYGDGFAGYESEELEQKVDQDSAGEDLDAPIIPKLHGKYAASTSTICYAAAENSKRYLNHNAPAFVPSANAEAAGLVQKDTGISVQQHQCSGAKIDPGQQQANANTTGIVAMVADIPDISLEDRKLLDALVSSTSVSCANSPHGASTGRVMKTNSKNKNKAVLVNKEDRSSLVPQDLPHEIPQTVNLGRDIYEEGEEDSIIQQCRKDAARKGDLSPMHSGQKQKYRATVIEDVNIRRPPMRNAKQKQAIQTTSTKSNRSKKKA